MFTKMIAFLGYHQASLKAFSRGSEVRSLCRSWAVLTKCGKYP